MPEITGRGSSPKDDIEPAMTGARGRSPSWRTRLARRLDPLLAQQADRARLAVQVAEHHAYSTPHRSTNQIDRAYMEGADLGRAQVIEVLVDGWNGNSGVLRREVERLTTPARTTS